MIKEFKDNPIRDFGNVYQSMLVQIKKRYAKDPVQAGELAISFIEYVLTNDISSDDDIIEGFIEGYKVTTTKNQNKYDAKVAATEERLKRVADLYNAGWKQYEIAAELGVQPPAISKQLAQIRSDFPHLLQVSERSKKGKKVSESSKKVEETQERLESFVDISSVQPDISENNSKVSLECEQGNVSKVSKNFPNNNDNNNNKNNDKSHSISPGGESGLCPDTPSTTSAYEKFKGIF